MSPLGDDALADATLGSSSATLDDSGPAYIRIVDRAFAIDGVGPVGTLSNKLFTVEVNEQNSARYSCTFVDQDGNPFGDFESLTVTLYDKSTETILNGRDDQSVMGAHNGTFDAGTGEFVWELQPEDNGIEDDGRRVEDHRARFTGVFAGGTRQVNDEIVLKVINLRRLP